MTVEFTDEQEAMVLRLAEQAGRTPAELFVETMAELRWIDDAEEQRLLDERIAEADRPNAIWYSNEEVGHRMGLL